MNFLAHLHIADHSNSHLLGNLLGDFVKGDPSKLYDRDISNGIRLHRFVDRITDHHPIVNECKPHFTGVARRFAPIALDMFWDHCLAKHWNDFHSVSLEHFVKTAYERVNREVHEHLPPRFFGAPQQNVAWPMASILSRSRQYRICTTSDVAKKS